MIVEIADDGVRVTEADDLRRLHAATSLTPAAVDAALRAGAAGRLDAPGEDGTAHVLLDLPALRRAAQAGDVGPDWDARWDVMIAYATRSGWVSADGQAVRAHLSQPI